MTIHCDKDNFPEMEMFLFQLEYDDSPYVTELTLMNGDEEYKYHIEYILNKYRWVTGESSLHIDETMI